MYRAIIRPLLFLFNPQKAHDLLLAWISFYKHLSPIRSFIQDYCKTTSTFIFRDLRFENRIGLSAGFDKNGVVFDQLADFGFGFVEVGTVTPHAQPGNPRPNIFRLVKDESLISRTGFNNDGLPSLLEHIKVYSNRNYRLGVNINKDADSVGEQTLADFELLFTELYPYVDYFTLNWGSLEPEVFEGVLERLTTKRKTFSNQKLIFIKLPADISMEILDNVVKMAYKQGVDGFIATGPTMDRSGLKQVSQEELAAIGAGGVSGKGIGDKSRDVVARLKASTHGDFLIIGAGGVMSPADARRMLDAGADLIQIYSAFIYSGPFVVREIGRTIHS